MLLPILLRSWGPDTCDPSDLADWHPGNPSRGQCGPTALVVREILGGDLVHGRVTAGGKPAGHHYWNRLPDGTELDLTRDQFRPGERIIGGELLILPTPTTAGASAQPGDVGVGHGSPAGAASSARAGSLVGGGGPPVNGARSSVGGGSSGDGSPAGGGLTGGGLTGGGLAGGGLAGGGRAVPVFDGPPRRCRGQHALLRHRVLTALGRLPNPDPATPALRLALALLVDPGGAVLLRRRSPTARFEPGQWAFPSAQIPPGSGPEEAARRALAEEAGIEFTGRLHRHWRGTLPDVTGRASRVEVSILAGRYELGESGILADDLSSTDLSPTAAVALQALIRSSRTTPVRAETAARRTAPA
jgi:8-oxo-dGTP pyrophosphatase MutT (NUDIX family)